MAPWRNWYHARPINKGYFGYIEVHLLDWCLLINKNISYIWYYNGNCINLTCYCILWFKSINEFLCTIASVLWHWCWRCCYWKHLFWNVTCTARIRMEDDSKSIWLFQNCIFLLDFLEKEGISSLEIVVLQCGLSVPFWFIIFLCSWLCFFRLYILIVPAILHRYGHPQFAPAAAEIPSHHFKRFCECKRSGWHWSKISI